MVLDPDVPYRDKAHLLERAGDTDGAYSMMVEGLERELEGLQRTVEALAQESVKLPFDSEEGRAVQAQLSETSTLKGTLARELKAWKDASEVKKGTRVRLESKRARARYQRKNGGGRVPHGTEGVVVWMGDKPARNGVFYTCALVVGDDQRGFYASTTSLKPLDPWETVQAALYEAEQLDEDLIPLPGDRVRHKKTKRTGELIWRAKHEPGVRRRACFLPDEPLNTDSVSRWGKHAGKKIVWAYLIDIETLTSWGS